MHAGQRFAEFAVREARGVSPTYERLATAVSADTALLTLLTGLPPAKQQPNLLFGVIRLLGGPVDDPRAFHDFTLAHWPAVLAELLARSTQTNEPGRCAPLLPVLASLRQPLALLEVGASAGLNLFPDQYAYRYTGTPGQPGPPHLPPVPGRADTSISAQLGTPRLPPVPGRADTSTSVQPGPHHPPPVPGRADTSTSVQPGTPHLPPVLDCAVTGAMPAARLPEVVWRAGMDLHPLDVTDPADVAWLDALIWPEHTHRRTRLRAAATIAAADPPHLVTGDLVDDLAALAGQAPPHAALVIFHTSVLYQVPPERKSAFTTLVRNLPAHWISIEAPEVLPFRDLPAPPDDRLHNVLALDGVPLAWVEGHGQAMTWFGRV
ncbi:DUF2332 domain-containing protein [Winogradskya humida]|uniref:DUF2332 domain-containing protein n=1 Tax=Winogradskya humida TaxID=113566 RepID=A0ABQ3ZVB9_9ACTN|nr:DUF2332 domain-containing protein [Actinoplanes humidus]GIE22479.1 hypothetical protein Ahu01nite_055810 [Actinoplanes humidus]